MSTSFVTFVSFFWYLEVSAVATPLTLAPARETIPNGILTGKLIKVLNIATLDIQKLHLGCSSKCLAIPIDLISWSTWSISLHTFPLVLTTLVPYFGLHLGSRIVVPRKPRVPLGDLDIYYSLSSF